MKKTRPNGFVPVSSKTENQKKYIMSIQKNDVVICSGPSGTGKSLIALGIAFQKYYKNEIGTIFVTRPMVATSEREFPYIKGTLFEKLEPYYAPIIEVIGQLHGGGSNGKKIAKELIEAGIVVLQPIELMRGFTYKNCCVLVTESQNMSVKQATMAITRIGEGCKMIFEGDTDQKDVRFESGLSFLIRKLEGNDDVCSVVQLDNEDIQRHPLIGRILELIKED